jgi:hypothetical protein
MGKRRCSHRDLVGKPEGKRPLGRLRRVWENNIKMYHQEGGWEHGPIDLSQNRDRWRVPVKVVMTIRVP